MTPSERRQHFREKLSPLYLPYYDKLCLELPLEHWAPYYGIRTFEEQDRLYEQGRVKQGSIVTNAKAGQSPHEYGCATDWAYFEEGQLIWLSDHDLRWDEYYAACLKVGVVLGANFHHPDVDHNELVIAHSWSKVLEVYTDRGEQEAFNFIERSYAQALKELSNAN